MYIVLDTNILMRDPMLQSAASQRMMTLLEPADTYVALTPMVELEIERKVTDEIRSRIEESLSRLSRLDRFAKSSLKEAQKAINDVQDTSSKNWRLRKDELLKHDRFTKTPWPSVTVANMAEREMRRRRPFQDKASGTTGHRDTIIWMNVLDLAKECDDDIIFVTADKGYLQEGNLHPDLLEDLEHNETESTVCTVGSITELNTLLWEEAKSTIGTDWRESAAIEASADFLHSLDGEDVSFHFNPSDGDIAVPEFDLRLPQGAPEWTLIETDGPNDLRPEDDVEFGSDSTVYTFWATFRLTGAMDKYEWFSDDHPSVTLWDANLNDHYVSVDAERDAKFRVALQIDDLEQSASIAGSVTLVDVRDEGRLTFT